MRGVSRTIQSKRRWVSDSIWKQYQELCGFGRIPWIDFTLGSDSQSPIISSTHKTIHSNVPILYLANGSCRKPAYWMGYFAIRPTTGVLDTRGVASFCP